MNVLILDGNENQAVACVRSLARAGHMVCVGSCSNWSKAGMSRHCAESMRYPNPRVDANGFIKSMVAHANKHPGVLILPMTEQTTLALSSHRDEIVEAGGRLVLASHETILRVFDKAETTRLARELGISVPETVEFDTSVAGDVVAKAVKLPAVMKPRSSFESDGEGNVQATGRPVYARSREEVLSQWEKLRERCTSVVIQEFIEGEGRGYFALMNEGALRAEFAHRRIRDVHPSGSGSSLRESVSPEPTIRDAALRLLKELRWHGVAMVEFRRRSDGTPVFLEVNGRFWNSLALAIYAGVDFPAMLADLAESGDIAVHGGYREGVRCRWLAGDFRHLIEVWRGPAVGYPRKYPGRISSLLNFLLPRMGTYHDNFTLNDPLPELGDWIDLIFRRIPAQAGKTIVRRELHASRGVTRP